MGRRGITTGEALLAVGVLLVLAAILSLFVLRSRRQTRVSDEAKRLRTIYVGVSMYQEDNAGRLPGLLTEAGIYLAPEDFLSPLDPFLGKPGPYPVEPTRPDLPAQLANRQSTAYFGHYGFRKLPPFWLASPWVGEVQSQRGFDASMTGPILRVAPDGALSTLPARKVTGTLQSPQDLFGATP